MKPKRIFGMFVAVAIVQLAVPISQIWKHENILRTGTPYKFRTAPVDPYDAFRGRYVALGFADTEAPVRAGETLEHRQRAYVGLRAGADGFVEYTELSARPPARGDYLRVTCSYHSGTTAHFQLPFDRFFMEEKKAPRAEVAYWRHGNRLGETNAATYVVVRVKGGRGVIEDLYIKDTPLREFLARDAAR